jgi:membrane-bound serine protease (ClpP class)
VRRLATVLLGAAAVIGIGFSFGAAAGAGAPPQAAVLAGEPSPASTLAPVDVFEVSGILDPILTSEIAKAVDRVARDGAQALILQLNSTHTTVARDKVQALATRIKHSPIPVAIWVGQSGAAAGGLAGQLIGVAAASGMAPGTHIGNFGEPLIIDGQALMFGDATETLRSGSLDAVAARTRGVLQNASPDPTIVGVHNMLLALDGMVYHGTTLNTVVERVNASGNVVQDATTPTFFKLGLWPRLFHTVGSVPVAYLLFVIGAVLLIFEFFTAGVGVGGGVGVVCFVLGCHGLGALPVRGWALALLVGSLLALAVDVQVGVPRFWTGLGMILFTVASVLLYRDLRLSWITLFFGIASVAMTFVVGMPSMTRTRFATPTIGREWMIGEMGVAVSSLSPDGVIELGAAKWRARTNRATPIAAGQSIRVVGIDGVTLDVEPESGGAKDYRERRVKIDGAAHAESADVT